MGFAFCSQDKLTGEWTSMTRARIGEIVWLMDSSSVYGNNSDLNIHSNFGNVHTRKEENLKYG